MIKKANKLLDFFKALTGWIKYGLTALRKKCLPQSLLYRFVLIILVPLLFLQAAVMIVFFDRHWDTVGHRLAQDVAGEIAVLSELIQRENLPLEYRDFVFKIMNKQLLLNASFEKEGVLPIDKEQQSGSKVRALISEIKAIGYPFVLWEREDGKTVIAVQLENGVLNVVIPRKRFFSSTIYVVLIWMFLFSVLLFWIAFLFMKNQVRAIERLSHAAESFGQGQALVSFKPEGATEVRQAGLSFIQMRNRLQRYLTERTGMLSGVSHDLRTPLTRMKLQLSMLEQTEAVQDLQSDVSEMERMLESYLSFARGEGKTQTEEISLNEALKELVVKQVKAGQDIDFHEECQVSCLCREDELIRAITNLIVNAKRYAGHANMTLGQYRKMARIIIDDDGPGIPEKKRKEVFRAFCRLDESRNTHTGGVGLGLTITRDIILSHGGEISLSDSPMGGLRVIVLLPMITQVRKEK
jgi:two-component system osmolarity sensor histidine kinase EnvZ